MDPIRCATLGRHLLGASRLALRARAHVPCRRRRLRRSADDGHAAGRVAGHSGNRRPIDVRVGCLFEFEDDRLLCERVYFDFLTILRQLGVA